ncbi:uncharacterized protein [Rutidosis leptorrhynchoides]|uniref:uncharacterized protein n=1 Tax=Rutidosis leptorrhynchoides TaxID=125765 RepID=UPI003A99E964
MILQRPSTHKETARNKLLPQKIGLFVWRANLERLPVRVELDKRGIDLDSVRCPICNNDIETVAHILLHCSFAKDLWSRVFRWWNLNRPMYANMGKMFQGNRNALSSQTSKLWQSVEWVCGYIIWRNRNLNAFQKKKGNGPTALNEVQLKSYERISRRSKELAMEWNQ